MSTRWKALVATFAVAATPVLVGTTASEAHAVATTVQKAKADSSLSIRLDKRKVQPGDTALVKGNLAIKGSADESGRLIVLEAKPEGAAGFTEVGSDLTGDRGGVRLEVSPSVTTKYRWRYAGAEDAQPTRSGIARLLVGEKPGTGAERIRTTLSIRATHRPVDIEGDSVIKGKLKARRVDVPNRTVQLLARIPGDDFTVASEATTDSDGRVEFPVSPKTRTSYRLRFEGDDLLRGSRSAVVRIGVRPQITLSASPQVLDPGQSTQLDGLVSYEGAPYVGATVDLFGRTPKPKTAKQAGWSLLGTSTTDETGAVSFSQTPKKSTAYRMVVRHSDGTPPRGVSDAVRVRVKVATSLSIRGRTTDEGYVVSGQLRGGGATIAKAAVTLETLAEDGVTWTPVATADTNGNGKVRFVQAAAEGANYRLTYAGGPRTAPCVSGVVVN